MFKSKLKINVDFSSKRLVKPIHLFNSLPNCFSKVSSPNFKFDWLTIITCLLRNCFLSIEESLIRSTTFDEQILLLSEGGESKQV